MALFCTNDRSRPLTRTNGTPPAPPERAVLTTVDGSKGYTDVAVAKTYTVRKTP